VWIIADEGTGTAVTYKSMLTRKEMTWRKAWRAGLDHKLYVDNFCTSPQLFKDLLEAGTLASRIAQHKRKGVPETTKGHVDPNDCLFPEVNMTEGYMAVAHWKDKTSVCTVHNPYQ